MTLPRTSANKIDVVVGLDARGFILGPLIALRLGASFVPIRKKGKLPGKCVQAEYQKEYGAVRIFHPPRLTIKLTPSDPQDIFEIQADSIAQDANVIVVDDLIATGMSELFEYDPTETSSQVDPPRPLVNWSRSSVEKQSSIFSSLD